MLSNRGATVFILGFSAVALGSCGPKNKTPAAKTLTEGKAEAPATFEHPDPGPTLQRVSGRLEALDKGPTQVASIFVSRGKDRSFVVLPDPHVTGSRPDLVNYTVDGAGTYGVAFPWISGEQREPGVIVKFVGEVPERFSVHYELATEDYRTVVQGQVGRYEATIPPATPARAELGDEFTRSAAEYMTNRTYGPYSLPFYSFATQRLRQMTSAAAAPTQQGRSDIFRTMELYSGMSSVNEALQHDRGLFVRSASTLEARTVPIDSIAGVELAAHPWERMIADLGKTPSVEPLASVIPADMAYIHFGDLRTFVKLVGDLDDWVSPVAQAFESRPGPSHFMSAYERQLVVERTGLAETLGHVAVAGVAIVTSDPFVREGTDVSMVFKVKNRSALVAALAGFEASAKKRRSDISESTWDLGGTKVRRLSTPDEEINQHRAEWGDVLVISNSEGAVRHLHAAFEQKVPTLADALDFRYMRARYPYDPKAEDGFVFFGDTFVARAIGPEVKILESRRMQAHGDIMAVNNAALLYGWLEGKRPADGRAIIDAGYLRKEELQHADGTKITFDPATGARSEVGTPTFLRPIRDLKIDQVTVEEQQAYEQFRGTYQSYWRGYIDPIAVRINRLDDGKTLAFDARMLPLIDNSEYDRMIEQVGRSRIAPPVVQGGIQWTFAVGADSKLRKELDFMTKSMVAGQNVGLGWLGDWVMVGLADRSGVWDLALATDQVPSLEPASEDRSGLLRQDFAGRIPVYAGAHVANGMGLAALLSAGKKWAADAAPGLVSWEQGEPYRDIPVIRIAEGPQGGGVAMGINIHYAIAENVFLIALDRPTLEMQIDAALAGRFAKTAPSAGEDASQTFIDYSANGGGYLEKTVLGLLEREIVASHPRSAEAFYILHRGLPETKLDQAHARSLGLGYLGFEPRNANGGSFSITSDGRVTHSTYGERTSPVLPELPVEGSTVARVVQGLERLSMNLAFDGEGDHRGLHSRITWQWK